MSIEISETEGKDGAELEAEVDRDFSEFAEWFRVNVDSDPITRNEMALLKTYVWHKTHPGQAPKRG